MYVVHSLMYQMMCFVVMGKGSEKVNPNDIDFENPANDPTELTTSTGSPQSSANKQQTVF